MGCLEIDPIPRAVKKEFLNAVELGVSAAAWYAFLYPGGSI